jgi:hypothetical protein
VGLEFEDADGDVLSVVASYVTTDIGVEVWNTEPASSSRTKL